MSVESIIIRNCGRDYSFSIELYTTVRELVTSRAFLDATTESPNRLTFFVNGEPVYDDCLLVPGDVVEFQTTCEKALISPREAIKRLQKLVGLTLHHHGGSHDKWKTADGRIVIFPRHSRDIPIGTLKNIIKQAGLDLSISEFVSQ